MDKLKPILAQKFWILAVICLLLPLTGWWMSTAAMSSEIATRTKAITDAFSGIPQPGPNENWTSRVKALNVEEEKKVKETGEYLWNQQVPLMTWPEVVRAGVEKAGYRGEIEAKIRGEYRYAYEQEILDLHQVVTPFDDTTGSGLVQFPLELIPSLGWGTSQIPPSSKEMWDSQEDIWLFRTLLQGVANINEQFGSSSIVDSKIKQIGMIELRGGTPGGAAAAAEAAGAMAGGEGAMPADGPAGMPGAMPGRGMPGAGGMGGAGGSDGMTASFDPAEQLGPDDDTSAAAAGGDPSAEGAGGPAGPGAMADAGAMPGRGMGMAGGGTAPKKRYIEETERFKTRGFYMELVMDHRCVPEFLAELSDSKWPLKVIRVQQVDVDLTDVGSTGSVGAGPGAMGGMPGGRGMPGAGRGAAGMGGMGGMGAMPRAGGAAPRLPGAGAGGAAGGRMPRPAGPAIRPGDRDAAGGGVGVESTLDVQSAMADPYLVNLALSGIITIYLPPGPPPGAEGAVPGTPGSPAPDATAAAPAATADAAAGAAAGTPPADPTATATTATGTPAEGTATAESKPATEAAPAGDAKPAGETAAPAANAKPADAKPAGDAKPGNANPADAAKPAADAATSPPAAEKPAAEKPAAEKPATDKPTAPPPAPGAKP